MLESQCGGLTNSKGNFEILRSFPSCVIIDAIKLIPIDFSPFRAMPLFMHTLYILSSRLGISCHACFCKKYSASKFSTVCSCDGGWVVGNGGIVGIVDLGSFTGGSSVMLQK